MRVQRFSALRSQNCRSPVTVVSQKTSKVFMRSLWEPRNVTFHAGSHSVTCHPKQINGFAFTAARQAGIRFTYPGGMEDWVDLVGWLYTVTVIGLLVHRQSPIQVVTTWQRFGRESNPQPVDCTSDALSFRYATKPTFNSLIHNFVQFLLQIKNYYCCPLSNYLKRQLSKVNFRKSTFTLLKIYS